MRKRWRKEREKVNKVKRRRRKAEARVKGIGERENRAGHLCVNKMRLREIRQRAGVSLSEPV